MSDDYGGIFCYDHIHALVMRLCRHLIHELESIAHSDSCGFCRLKQTVIESLSTSKTVPFTVVCHGRHYYKLYFRRIYSIRPGGLLYMEATQLQT